MAHSHVIAYSGVTFTVIDMKVLGRNIASVELWHVKCHLYIMSGTVHYILSNILYFVSNTFCLVRIYIFIFDHTVGINTIPHACYSSKICFSKTFACSKVECYDWLGNHYWDINTTTTIKFQDVVNGVIYLNIIYVCNKNVGPYDSVSLSLVDLPLKCCQEIFNIHHLH